MYLLFTENPETFDPSDYIGCTDSDAVARRMVLESTLPHAYPKYAASEDLPESATGPYRNVMAVRVTPTEDFSTPNEEQISARDATLEQLRGMAGDDDRLQALVNEYEQRLLRSRIRSEVATARRTQICELVKKVKKHVGNSANMHFIIGKMMDLGLINMSNTAGDIQNDVQ
jgi:hypothetical protein